MLVTDDLSGQSREPLGDWPPFIFIKFVVDWSSVRQRAVSRVTYYGHNGVRNPVRVHKNLAISRQRDGIFEKCIYILVLK